MRIRTRTTSSVIGTDSSRQRRRMVDLRWMGAVWLAKLLPIARLSGWSRLSRMARLIPAFREFYQRYADWKRIIAVGMSLAGSR
jgi:hypothetical protein